jgi:alpha/beta superfamily hydrolase
MPRRIESLFIPGPAGRLEALLEEPEDRAPAGAALVCHPHPRHGGTMHNKVVYRMARGLRRAGHVVLRFNYRGVNLSEGSYAQGEGELEDARAALDLLRARYPELPLTLAGFSFGARVVLRLGAAMGAETQRVIAVGFPAVYANRSALYETPSEEVSPARIFIHSTRDQYGSVEDLTGIVKRLREPKQLVLIDAEDHFFAGGLELLEATIRGV